MLRGREEEEGTIPSPPPPTTPACTLHSAIPSIPHFRAGSQKRLGCGVDAVITAADAEADVDAEELLGLETTADGEAGDVDDAAAAAAAADEEEDDDDDREKDDMGNSDDVVAAALATLAVDDKGEGTIFEEALALLTAYGLIDARASPPAAVVLAVF